MYEIKTFIKDKIWIIEYPVKYSGINFYSRTTIIRLNNDSLAIHSPCKIDDKLKTEILKLGSVSYIIAPGNFHHLYVESAQVAFTNAKTYITEGIIKKNLNIKYDGILTDAPILSEFEQQPVLGSRIMNEVAFFHKETRTLILVDLIENIGKHTEGAGIGIKIWWIILRMWNKPKPAPEYQFGWKDKPLAAKSLHAILNWDFDKIILAHGDLITSNAKEIATKAWYKPLKYS
ncbi:DUF4336 domain-containing protein [Francisella adeliensis]|uniref:DUF4336 domain-containing protein n=1 Tax=Francisella adeliensis TaxID=2007306 RepID=A0A2Z4XXV8_9GAMM|nr:DUF4336 domain-containing protein [Francisella adeliensis]AXA33448.1 hypothetical protein CDH04_03025 [Francisella adeliensis]MBK2085468.1 DUF4336 domain-containing protein [Francisella adeliensis]MBK2097198.1 DUF4336 domain-containing protein [Francisella adeliensis]QIW11676.1 DUF4336 domain-containing protein [Francisella adeliensis]QIW13551.1 DUF4336 domain-containing protein [Francisella adeliensis]